jgi:hypothetical protein
MTNALDQFIAEYRAPKSAITVAGDFECRDWVHTAEHGWNPCAVRKTSMWGDCPNKANHGRPVLKAKTQEQITEGDRVNFYHPASNQDQWATVLAWTVGSTFPDGSPMTWDAVLHIERLSLGNGFSAGTKVQRHTFRRYESCGIKYATDGSFQ